MSCLLFLGATVDHFVQSGVVKLFVVVVRVVIFKFSKRFTKHLTNIEISDVSENFFNLKCFEFYIAHGDATIYF